MSQPSIQNGNNQGDATAQTQPNNQPENQAPSDSSTPGTGSQSNQTQSQTDPKNTQQSSKSDINTGSAATVVIGGALRDIGLAPKVPDGLGIDTGKYVMRFSKSHPWVKWAVGGAIAIGGILEIMQDKENKVESYNKAENQINHYKEHENGPVLRQDPSYKPTIIKAPEE